MNYLYSQEHMMQKERLVETIRYLHHQGWAPATSSNYSIRATEEFVCISRSGVDKQYFTSEDLIYVNLQGVPVFPPNAHPSAETLLHLQVYARYPRAQCVLHTHSVLNTVVSLRYARKKKLIFEGFELQKALLGQDTHEGKFELPIFPNTQDIPSLANQVAEYSRRHPDMVGYLIAGHGLYAWGESIAEAKRHIEALEFLLACRQQLDVSPLVG